MESLGIKDIFVYLFSSVYVCGRQKAMMEKDEVISLKDTTARKRWHSHLTNTSWKNEEWDE